MVQTLLFVYESQRVRAPAPQPPSVEAALKVAAEKLGITANSYDLYDAYGKIEVAEDLQRALHVAGAGDCIIQVKEHEHFVRLRTLEGHKEVTEERLAQLEEALLAAEKRTDSKVSGARADFRNMCLKLEGRLDNEVKPALDTLMKDKNKLQKDVRWLVEKIGSIDIEEMRDISDSTQSLRAEVQEAIKKVDDMQTLWLADKSVLTQHCLQSQKDLLELQRYLQGKIDVCIEADADLRREQQLCNERMHIVADDLRLLTDEHTHLARQCAGALEESEELRTLLGQVREDNEHLKADHGHVRTRVHCIEGRATEPWEGFAPGMLYFKHWHRTAKGQDVQFSPDMQVATGRGFLGSTGMIVGNYEGLAVADGPCRRFGTPGSFSSYFEVEVVEVKSVPGGVGGLWVGVSLQTADEIAAHPQKEFDGWLVGGCSKAMVSRAGQPPDLPVDPAKVPGTFALGPGQPATTNIQRAMQLLRQALPPRGKGEMREFGSMWDSQALRKGDRVGVLWRCNRDSGARMRVSVNGTIVLTQEFADAPMAEAVGFFTPVVRIAGACKSARICPGLSPPSRMLAN